MFGRSPEPVPSENPLLGGGRGWALCVSHLLTRPGKYIKSASRPPSITYWREVYLATYATMPSPQFRYWMLTLPQHEYTPFLHASVAYVRGQLESGGTTGYLHWQLLVIFERKKTLAAVKSVFGNSCHCEPSRSSAADAYVWKEDTRVEGTQFELGSRPHRRNNKLDWERVWEAARAGSIEEIPASVRVQNYRTLRTIMSDYSKPVGMERTVNVYWGKSGTGKSRRAHEEAGVDAYSKNPLTKWWDGYRNNEHVIIDEFRGAIDVANLLRWFDRYPVYVEVKGAAMPLNAKKFWVTSNLHPNAWYPNLDEETRIALLRRLNITEFLSL